MRTERRICALLAAIACAATPLGCNKGPSPATVVGGGGQMPQQVAQGGVTARPGSEVEDVKAMIREMSQKKSLTELAPYFSNRSAAAMGVFMMIPLAFISAFAGMPGQTAASPAEDKKVKEVKAVVSDMQALTKKYGMDKSKSQAGGQPSKEELARLEGRGREFLTEVGGIMDRFSKTEAGKGQGMTNSNEFAKDLNNLDFTVVSPSEVKITDKKKKPNDPDTRAVVEDGKWRLDFGGFDTLAKSMQGSLGAPVMGAQQGAAGRP